MPTSDPHEITFDDILEATDGQCFEPTVTTCRVRTTIHWSESACLAKGAVFETAVAADEALLNAAWAAPSDGTYHKTKVTLLLGDKHRLTFRVDLQHPSHTPFRGLLDEALDFLDYAEQFDEPGLRAKAFILRGHIIAAQMF